MSTRVYDYTLTLSGGSLDNYFSGNVVVGSSSSTEGRIVDVDKANSKIKVKQIRRRNYLNLTKLIYKNYLTKPRIK